MVGPISNISPKESKNQVVCLTKKEKNMNTPKTITTRAPVRSLRQRSSYKKKNTKKSAKNDLPIKLRLKCKRAHCRGVVTLIGQCVGNDNDLADAVEHAHSLSDEDTSLVYHGSCGSCSECGDRPIYEGKTRRKAWQRYCALCQDVFAVNGFWAEHGGSDLKQNEKPLNKRSKKHKDHMLKLGRATVAKVKLELPRLCELTAERKWLKVCAGTNLVSLSNISDSLIEGVIVTPAPIKPRRRRTTSTSIRDRDAKSRSRTNSLSKRTSSKSKTIKRPLQNSNQSIIQQPKMTKPKQPACAPILPKRDDVDFEFYEVLSGALDWDEESSNTDIDMEDSRVVARPLMGGNIWKDKRHADHATMRIKSKMSISSHDTKTIVVPSVIAESPLQSPNTVLTTDFSLSSSSKCVTRKRTASNGSIDSIYWGEVPSFNALNNNIKENLSNVRNMRENDNKMKEIQTNSFENQRLFLGDTKHAFDNDNLGDLDLRLLHSTGMAGDNIGVFDLFNFFGPGKRNTENCNSRFTLDSLGPLAPMTKIGYGVSCENVDTDLSSSLTRVRHLERSSLYSDMAKRKKPRLVRGDSIMTDRKIFFFVRRFVPLLYAQVFGYFTIVAILLLLLVV